MSGAKKHKATIEAISQKLNHLRQLVESDRHTEWKGRPSFDQFCNWEDPSIGVRRCSKSNFTPRNGNLGRNASYAALKQDIQTTLSLLSEKLDEDQKKSRLSSRQEMKELKVKLKAAQYKAQCYVNDYTAAQSELYKTRLDLARAQQIIARLEERLRQCSKVVSVDFNSKN